MPKPNRLSKEQFDDLVANVGALNYQFNYGGRIYQGLLRSVDVYSRFQDYIEVYVNIDPYPALGPTYGFYFLYWNEA